VKSIPNTSLGCGLVSIITPETSLYVMRHVEQSSDIILGWDGKKLLMLKNRTEPNLKSVSAALRCISQAAPTAAWGSLVKYRASLAKLPMPPPLPHGMDGVIGSRYQRPSVDQNTDEMPLDTRIVLERKVYRSKSDTRRRGRKKEGRS